MNKLKIILRHLKNGSLFDRIVNYKKHRLFKEYADFEASEKKYIEKKVSDNITMRLFKNANLSKELYCYGFEDSEITFFKRYLKPGDTVLDVGANIGLFTLIASEKIEKTGKVFSFEPSPQTFNWLQENIQSNRLENVIAYKSALSDKDGKIDFYLSAEGFDAFNSIIKPSKGQNYTKESVPTLTMDTFVNTENLQGKITFIKIDVEGFEISLLAGAQKILSEDSAPDLIVEFTESNAKNAGVTCADLYNKIVSLGYQLFQYNSRSNILIAEPRGMDYSRYKNLIATKHPEKVNQRLKRS